MEKLLRILFLLVAMVSFTLAVEDRSPVLALGGFLTGMVGLIATPILFSYLSHRRFYRAVEEHARSCSVTYSAGERMSRDFRSALFVVLELTIFVAGIVLTIVTDKVLFVGLAFLGMVSYGVATFLKQLSERKESWEDAARRLNLAYAFDKAQQMPRFLGAFRGREVFVSLQRVSSLSGGSSGGYLSRSGAFIGTSSSSFASRELAIISAKVDAPETMQLTIRGGKRESDPPELASYLLGKPGIEERVEVVAPFAEIEMRPPAISLKWSGAVSDFAELRFLLDLLCDIAEAVEGFRPTAGEL